NVEFQIRQREGRFSALAQDVDSMSDSQIRDVTVALANGCDHVFEQTTRVMLESAWTPSPSPRMRDNPFRARQLFWSRMQGSPSGPHPDQIKPEWGLVQNTPRYDNKHFCRLT